MAKTQRMKEREMERQDEREEQSAHQLRPSAEPYGRRMREAQPGEYLSGDGWRRGRLKRLNDENISRGLGWFSIGLGLAERAAPRGLTKLIGLRGDHSGLLRTLGMREIASGIGILTEPRPAAGLWSRGGGGGIVLALLGA